MDDGIGLRYLFIYFFEKQPSLKYDNAICMNFKSLILALVKGLPCYFSIEIYPSIS